MSKASNKVALSQQTKILIVLQDTGLELISWNTDMDFSVFETEKPHIRHDIYSQLAVVLKRFSAAEKACRVFDELGYGSAELDDWRVLAKGRSIQNE